MHVDEYIALVDSFLKVSNEAIFVTMYCCYFSLLL